MRLTAPKKTWGGQWFPQGSFFVATFVTGGQESASNSPTFLSCKTLATSLKKQKMGHKNKTYIIFDGDNDKWAYARMKGWKALEHIDFDFENAHDEYTLTNNASNEDYIKGKLRKRFQNASQVIVLIGESTKNLYKYVRWELEVAQNLNIPIIAVNLNGDKKQNTNTCPPIIRDTYVVHIPFKMRIIKYALDNFPAEFKKRDSNNSVGGRIYNDSVYSSLGLND